MYGRKYNSYQSEVSARKRQEGLDKPIISVAKLPVKRRGHPLLLGTYDSQVQDYMYVRNLCPAGGASFPAVVAFLFMNPIQVSRDLA